jgi:hypothetical protein
MRSEQRQQVSQIVEVQRHTFDQSEKRRARGTAGAGLLQRDPDPGARKNRTSVRNNEVLHRESTGVNFHSDFRIRLRAEYLSDI